MPALATPTDAELVAASLDGDRKAFARIVERYQRLLCSLAYAATGRLSESEDLAQETFVTAWQHLRSLREPGRLRPWLCGILRHKVSRLRRREEREPVRDAGALDAAAGLDCGATPAPKRAMDNEEQQLLWRALEQVPSMYREPLVLYYREHRSVEHVADALDLTEDAVKQRLSRGRKILQERVLAFVEGALVRTTPGRAFTLGVLAAIPALIPAPAKAAGIGVAVAHGSTLVKTTVVAAVLASVSGVVTTLMGLRISLDQARTPRERRVVVKSTIACFFGALAFLLVIWALRAAASHWWESRGIFAVAAQVLAVAAIVFWPMVVAHMLRHSRRLRSKERRDHPEYFREPRDQVGSSASVYRSRAALFGVPLIHFRFSAPDDGEKPVVGWIAGGDRAYGLLFAWGAVAVAPVSVGLVAVGLVSVGSLGVGMLGLGTVGVGYIAFGCLAGGGKAFAWLSAMGWTIAAGSGFGVARTAAVAPIAYAEHANTAAAYEFMATPAGANLQMIVFVLIAVLSLVPVTHYAGEVRRRLGRARQRNG